MSKEDGRTAKELIDHLELQVDRLIRRYQRQRQELTQLKEERIKLQSEVAALKEETNALKEHLSVATLSAEGDAPQGGDITWITDELTALADEVNECIDLLDKLSGESFEKVKQDNHSE